MVLGNLNSGQIKIPGNGDFYRLHFFDSLIGNKICGSFRGVAEALQEAVKIMILIQIKKPYPRAPRITRYINAFIFVSLG